MKNKKGETYVTVCVLILVIVTAFSVIFTYSSMISKVRTMKTNTEVVFDSFVAKNSIIIFNNIKQGSNATRGVDTDKFNESLIQFCTLYKHDGMLYSIDADGKEKFRISVPYVGFINKEKLELYASFDMYMPMHFAGRTITTVKIPVRVTSELVSKK